MPPPQPARRPQADLVGRPVPDGATHTAYGVLLHGRGMSGVGRLLAILARGQALAL